MDSSETGSSVNEETQKPSLPFVTIKSLLETNLRAQNPYQCPHDKDDPVKTFKNMTVEAMYDLNQEFCLSTIVIRQYEMKSEECLS